MKKKYLITKLVIILILSLVISCQNKNAEILQKQQNIQTSTVQANPENTETKKMRKLHNQKYQTVKIK